MAIVVIDHIVVIDQPESKLWLLSCLSLSLSASPHPWFYFDQSCVVEFENYEYIRWSLNHIHLLATNPSSQECSWKFARLSFLLSPDFGPDVLIVSLGILCHPLIPSCILCWSNLDWSCPFVSRFKYATCNCSQSSETVKSVFISRWWFLFLFGILSDPHILNCLEMWILLMLTRISVNISWKLIFMTMVEVI